MVSDPDGLKFVVEQDGDGRHKSHNKRAIRVGNNKLTCINTARKGL